MEIMHNEKSLGSYNIPKEILMQFYVNSILFFSCKITILTYNNMKEKPRYFIPKYTPTYIFLLLFKEITRRI